MTEKKFDINTPLTLPSTENPFEVPLEEHLAKQSLSYVPGAYASLVKKRKELKIQEDNLEMDLEVAEAAAYDKIKNDWIGSPPGARELDKLIKTHYSCVTIKRQLIQVGASRSEIEGYMKALELKSKSLDVIIRSDIGDKYIQR